jgi:bifunctional oligoribonuclease and PAP phosphatase NrnA
MAIPRTHFETCIKKIDAAESVLITATASADGDSIGAQLALGELIQQLNPRCRVVIINETVCPPRYRFLPGAETIQPYSAKAHGTARFDLAFVLDGGSERCGNVKPLFDRSPFRVLVDHHRYGSSEPYELQLNDAEASSTAEIVFSIYDICRNRVTLTPSMAAALYLAIIFDTGFFRFSLTTPKTMRIAAELIETGIDFSTIAAKGMVETTPTAKRLLGEILKNFKFEKGGRLAWGQVPKNLVKRVRAKSDDHERIIENLCYIIGVEVAVLFLEMPKRQVKVSWRSRNHIDVGGIARSFDGGGHARAAGCTLYDTTLATAVKKVLGTTRKALNN